MSFIKPLIRRMKINDLDDVLAVERSCFRFPWTRRMFEGELNNINAHYYVVEVNGKAVGYMGFWKIIDEAHVTNVAIHKDYRRLGYGRALINAILSRVNDLEAIAVTLEVRTSNLAAITLYESFGFISSGVRKGYYSDNNEDALIMWLNL